MTKLVLEPTELLRRLAALCPAPGTHLTRFHGVFANRSKLRSRLPPPPPSEHVVPVARTHRQSKSGGERQHSTWAQLLSTFHLGTVAIEGTWAYERTGTGPASRDLLLGDIHSESFAGDWYLDGALDDVRIWSTERTAADIAASVRSLGDRRTGLEALWTFDDVTDLDDDREHDDLRDASPNARHAELEEGAELARSGAY